MDLNTLTTMIPGAGEHFDECRFGVVYSANKLAGAIGVEMTTSADLPNFLSLPTTFDF